MSTVSPQTEEATATILGVGTAVPKYRVNCNASARFAAKTSCVDSAQSRKVDVLYRRTGIEHRGSVLLDEAPGEEVVNDFYPPAQSLDCRGPGTKLRNDRYAEEAPVLAEQSSSAALAASGLTPDQITHLVTVSCTGFNSPGIDIALIDNLNLPETTERIQVGFMGCHGSINGLRAARGLVAAREDAKVLMCSVELCSLHYQYGLDTDRIVSNALFADGSAAMVLEAGPKQAGLLDHGLQNGASEFAGQGLGSVQATGSCLVPKSRDAMTWCIGDHGYQMTLSAQVPHLIEEYLADFLSKWLSGYGESIESIGGWIVHPGGSRILSAVDNALGLSPEELAVSRAVLAENGNMSSATMLFILERFAAMNKPKPWLMLGFGPGLEIEVALIR
ncbi:MAG: type III polyketide synthase [Rubripirellula sp.]